MVFFGVGKISNIFFGCLKFLLLLGRTIDAGPEPTYEEKLRVAPPLWDYKACEDTICMCIYQWITFSLHFKSKLI